MVGTPWFGKRLGYAGWVPNVHSHLSFSLIGAGRGADVLPVTVGYPEPDLKRLVAVHQVRQTDDFLAPLWWTRWRRKAARQNFILVGVTEKVQTPIGVVSRQNPTTTLFIAGLAQATRSALAQIGLMDAPSSAPTETALREKVETAPDAQGMLRGTIHILPHQLDVEYAAFQADILVKIKSVMRRLPHALDVSVLDGFRGQVAKMVKSVNRPASIEFALFRTGEARLWFAEEATVGFSPEQLEVLARQAYFFLKDMVHHHVHHDARSDQITPLVSLAKRPEDDREEHWRRATAWSLTRIVDALARRGKLQDLREATGILAYADAFQTTLLKYRRRTDDPASFEANDVTYSYDYKHIRESLKVQLDQASARRANLGQMVIAGLAGCIAATSLLASTISAHNGLVDANSKPKSVIPILPGLPDEWLTVAAQYYLLPSLMCASFLAIVSWQVLAEDRIGARRVKGRKIEQAVRGITNSVARKRGWSARTVQRIMRGFYVLTTIGLVFATVQIPSMLLRIAAAIGEVNPVAALGAARDNVVAVVFAC